VNGYTFLIGGAEGLKLQGGVAVSDEKKRIHPSMLNGGAISLRATWRSNRQM